MASGPMAVAAASSTISLRGPMSLNVAPVSGRRLSAAGSGSAAVVDHAQEFRARAGVLADGAEHLARDHRYTGLVDAAGGHALVLGLDHHADALRLQHVLDGIGDLGGHLLLHLEAA